MRIKDDFITHWVSLAKQQKDNVYKFFCLYIAFNYLYNEQHAEKEYLKIKNYILDNHKSIVFDNKFTELNKNVKDARTGGIKDYITNETNHNLKLIFNVYQVRCNLFHGSKFMKSDRDIKLIDESIEVLSIILGVNK